jgi:SAM-dependent methyltransferase
MKRSLVGCGVFALAWTIVPTETAQPQAGHPAAVHSDPHPDIMYVPTSPGAVEAMLKMAHVERNDIVYDLGSGDGRIVIAAARMFGAKGVGIDIDPRMIGIARQNAKQAGVENLVRFEQGNIFAADIHQATVVTLYLLTSINLRLRPKLLRELKPGTRIVSNTFDMANRWKPDESMTVGIDDYKDNPYLNPTLYLWVVPRPHSMRH